jgi:hypothetical protein
LVHPSATSSRSLRSSSVSPLGTAGVRSSRTTEDIMSGVSATSPEAADRMPSSSVSPNASFGRKPIAPARSACTAVTASACAESTITRVFG